MINLCLVVIATQFSETKKRETERMMQERRRFQSCSTLASNSEPAGCYTELLKLLGHVYRRLKRKIVNFYFTTRGLQKINPEKSLPFRRKKAKKKGIGRNHVKSHITHQFSHVSQNPSSHNHPHFHPSPLVQSPQFQHDLQSCKSFPHPSLTSIAPRASPETSDIDSVSSPRRLTFLVVPESERSCHPSSESLLTPGEATGILKHFTSSPNRLSAHFAFTPPLSLSQASSITGGSHRVLPSYPSLPEVLAAQGAKNAALAASNLFLNADSESRKTQSVADKGECVGVLAVSEFSMSSLFPPLWTL